MLKDRRALMEQDLVLQKRACGRLYLDIAMGRGSGTADLMYESMKNKLADLQSELTIIDQMIADGAE